MTTSLNPKYSEIFSEIYSILSTTYAPDAILKWLNTPNSHLFNQIPVIVINRGEGLIVREVAYASQNGKGDER